MIDDATLIEKRKELKLQLEAENYSTIPDVIFSKIGGLIRKLTRKSKKPSIWLSSMVIFLIVSLIGLLISYIVDGSHLFQGIIIALVLITIAAGSISMVVGKIFVDKIFTEFRVHLIDSIQSIADLTDLQSWVTAICNNRYQFICGLFYGLLGPSAVLTILSNSEFGFIGVGPTISILISYFQAGLLAYYIFLYLVLPSRLSRYKYKLYLNDPSQSNIIDHLSTILTSGLFLFSIVMTIPTVSVSIMWRFYPTEVRIFSLSLLWIPIIVIFVINQSALSKIVRQSKKRKLGEIQARIEKLEQDDDIVNKETIEAINRLMDYHDRIRDSKNSTLDVRSVINFLNSLLLPLISTLLSRIGQLLSLFK